MKNKLQFGVEDIVRKLAEIESLPEKEKEGTMAVLTHDLLSELRKVYGCLSLFCANRPELGKMISEPQQAYAHNLENKWSILRDTVKEALSKQNQEAGSRLISELQQFAENYPLMAKMIELGEISEGRKNELQATDQMLEAAVYTYNINFSPNFQRSTYLLEDDINHFKLVQISLNSRLQLIGYHSLDPLETKVDYFGKVVLPLIKNVMHHAFEPGNDINGRLKQPPAQLILFESQADEERKEVTITVEDNGFGIRPEIYARLFERGVSSKADKEVEHGLGLWAAKKFVEENGGRIWCETKLGKGTKFHFTIPYLIKEGEMYKQ